jgi:hypothetical protein
MQILDVFLNSQAYFFVLLVPLQTPPRVWSASVWQIYCCDNKEWGNLSAFPSYECEDQRVDFDGGEQNYFTS